MQFVQGIPAAIQLEHPRPADEPRNKDADQLEVVKCGAHAGDVFVKDAGQFAGVRVPQQRDGFEEPTA